jgi:hypothetical protein
MARGAYPSDLTDAENLLGIAVASLRQTAIQQLILVVGCDGLHVAAHTDLSLGAVGTYVRAFGRRLPPADRP